MAMSQLQAYQFKITLRGITPPIWRRILVSDRYSLFDLHIAIQSAMGWKDRHLHTFRFSASGGRTVEAGSPDLELLPAERARIPSWNVDAGTIFGDPGTRAEYEYDFGDGWVHEVLLEAITPRTAKTKLPRCIAGERACPPEDCGGPHGYEDLLRILGDASDPAHQDMILWLGRPFDPERFDAATVRFFNPRRKLEGMLAAWRQRGYPL